MRCNSCRRAHGHDFTFFKTSEKNKTTPFGATKNLARLHGTRGGQQRETDTGANLGTIPKTATWAPVGVNSYRIEQRGAKVRRQKKSTKKIGPDFRQSGGAMRGVNSQYNDTNQ